MKLVTIVGARPQFIKAAMVSRAIARHNTLNSDYQINEILVHTGQHYDHNMSEIFFKELDFTTPHHNLNVGSGRHGEMTGKMLPRIEEVLLNESPDAVMVYGDTNSTLAGALAAAKIHIPVAHVEAGLRSFNRRMPEEINRVLTDKISDFLFCPTTMAVENLAREGMTQNVFQVGDVMYDSFLINREKACKTSPILSDLGLETKNYSLATIHREENTDDLIILNNIFNSFDEIAGDHNPIIIPLHPRTRKAMGQINKNVVRNQNIHLIPPVGYLDLIALVSQAGVILTDSGGIQKEAYFAKVPCVTLREETEWIETIEQGWNHLGGRDPETILLAYKTAQNLPDRNLPPLYGDGNASRLILQYLLHDLAESRYNSKYSLNVINN